MPKTRVLEQEAPDLKLTAEEGTSGCETNSEGAGEIHTEESNVKASQ